MIGAVTTTPLASFRDRTRRARIAAAFSLLVLAAVAVTACGGSAATAPAASSVATSMATLAPTATPSPTASPSPSPSPTVEPAAVSLLPVPDSRFSTAAPVATLTDKATAALEAALTKIRGLNNYPGVSAAVMFPDGSVWTGVAGYAVRSSKVAVTPDTLFSIGSITKTFVAAAVLRLANAGTVGLDDPLAKYVPTFPNAAAITVRMLLNHTSGVHDLFDSLGPRLLASPAAAWSVDQVLAGIGRPYFTPGHGYHYSNTDYVLLGLVIEKATGKTVAAFIRSDLLDPLGLTHTFYQVTEKPVGQLAHGYKGKATAFTDVSAGSMIPFTAEATAVGSAGAYVSTASDIARWAAALYDGNVLDLADLSAMSDVWQTARYKPSWPYGLGFEETGLAGYTAWGHRGNLDGFWSAMWYLPDAHVSIVVLVNAGWADVMAASSALATAALAK